MRLKRHISYANVMSTLAVFLVVAGGSFAIAAVGKNEIKSKQVKNNSLKSKDLKDGKGVTGKDVKDGSLTGSDIGANSLTGDNIDESSLGKVPEAGALDGLDSSDLEQIKGEGDLTAAPFETILAVPEIGLEVRTDGDVDDDMEVSLHNTGTTSFAHLVPGGASVVFAGTGESVTAPGDFAASYTDGDVDGDIYSGAARLDAVVSKGPVRAWVSCVFPVSDVLCTATVFP